MIDAVTSCNEWKSGTDTRAAKSGVVPKSSSQPEAESLGLTTVEGRPGLAKDRRLRLRVSAVGFLAALVLTLVVTPFVQGLKEGQLCETLLFTLVMCTGLIASGSRRRLAFTLVSFALAAAWLNELWPQKCPALTFILPGIAFLGIVTASLLRFILRTKRVDANVLCAGISVYLILGLLWGLAYTFVAQVNPNAFSFTTRSGTAPVMAGFTAIYFSFTTLMTVGYGDITPAADVARMLALLEAMTGTLFVGVMIARLVSLYSRLGAKSDARPRQSQRN
jgi:voltage-gated potassium channel Kch